MTPDITTAARFAAGLALSPGDASVQALRRHGLAQLIAMRRAESGERDPELEGELRGAIAVEIARQRELAALLDDLAAAGVAPIAFKGAALASSVYPAPWARPRGDVDLLIRAEERDVALRVLGERGYSLPLSTAGEEVMNQRLAVRHEGSLAHHVDVHWRLSNTPGFADRFRHDELLASAAGIPALGPNARRPSDAWSLLIACAHRIAHHRDHERAIWLYDIHLLATVLGSEGMSEVERIARSEGMWSVVVDGLEAARTIFGTEVDRELAFDRGEWSFAFLSEKRTAFRNLMVELRQLPARRALRLLREHAFPPASFMRARHPGSRAPLAWLYLRRIARGWRKWQRTIS